MRVSFVVRVVAIVAVFTVSVTGQQQSVYLPLEPARVPSVMTLADAARHNNYPAFDAMFANAEPRDAAAYAELHSFWKWSLTDRIGAFYGDDQHAKFAAEYPDYANYIADFGIIDSHGNAYYPSAETRTFLLRKAETAAAAVVADAGQRASRPHVTAVPAVTRKPVVVAKVKPVVVKAAKPVVKVAAKVVAPKVAVVEKPIVVEQPKVVAKPVEVAKPVVVAAPHTVAARDAQPLRPGRPLSTGLVLIFAGLIALGMLSMLFRASGEEEPVEPAAHEPMRIISLDEKPKKTA